MGANGTHDILPNTLPVSGGPKQTTKYELLQTSNPNHYQNKMGVSSINIYAFACALLASMNSILLGYDVGVTSGALLFIKEDLKISEVQEEVLVSSLSFVSLAGSICAGRLADGVGRRWTMALAACVFLIGALGMGLAPSFSLLMVGRVLAGFGVGIALMVAPVYTAEVAPCSCRGSLVSFPEIFINVGILSGYVSNYAFSGLPAYLAWRVMLALGILPALCLAVGVIFMPESPRWLVMQGRIDEARKVIIRTSSDPVESEQRLADIMEAAGFVSNIEASLPEISGNKGQNVWRELIWPSASVKRMLVVASGIQFFQQATGIDAIVYYSPEVFKYAGIGSKSGIIAATVAMGFIKCAFIMVATVSLDRIGRRPLLLASASGMACALTSIAFSFLFVQRRVAEAGADGNGTEPLAIFVIFFVCCYVASFSIGMGPVVWVLTTEVFPLRLRAQGMSLCITISRLTSTLVSLTFLSLTRIITFAGVYFVFVGVSICSVIFFSFYVPETKGKTLEETMKLFCDDDELSATELNKLVNCHEEKEKHVNVSEDSEAWMHHDDEDIMLHGLVPHSNSEGRTWLQK